MLKRFISMLILSFILLCGCGPAQTIKPGDLVLAIGGESAEGYDPTMGWGRYGHPLFHSTLLKLDENLNTINDLAVSHTVSNGGLVWTVRIRDNVLFSNGDPLTADDVAYTYNTAAQSGGKADLAMLKEAAAVGPNRIRFTLKYPYIGFIGKLRTLGIVPANIHRTGRNYARNPVGSGPYKFVSWTEGQQLIVEANPYYYGMKPSIKRMIFLFMDEDTSFAAAKAGRVHVVALPPILGKQKIPGMTVHPVRSVDNRGIMFPCVPDTGKKTPEGYSIGNNVTSDIAIRKAINYTVDRRLLAATVLEGFGEPAWGIVDNLPWDEPSIRIKDNDPATARKILKDGGWVDTDGDGIVEKNGTRAEFTLLYYSNDSVRQNLSLACADMGKKIGIKINVAGKSSDEILRLNHSCAVLYGYGSHSPEEMYNLFHGKFAGIEQLNAGFYRNPTVDRYLDKAMSSSTVEESNRYWKLAQWDGKTGMSVRGDAAWAWLVNLTHVYFISDTLDVGASMIEPHGHGWPITANIEKWRFTK
ncbi:MAG TPA: ABC transporter substrate-binding protein [Spirochaetota bacterium]|nr:ABC transporter substrate-binding protein [Spirochaetota bacterium]